ncbi:MAG: TIR domain-containing protein [Pseudomonadota bacterium]
MSDIFLSYSREDNATATRFAEAFKRAGFSVWWDQALRSGETYDEVTERALREAKAVVVLWSRTSVNSRWVRSEAKIADRHGTLMPVMIEACERPVMFELMQSADLTRWKGDENDTAWRTFVDDVRTHVGRFDPQQAAPVVMRNSRIRGLRIMLPLALLVLSGLGAWWLYSWRTPGLLHLGQRHSIAVLPFLDLTAAQADAPLAEGLAEEITNWLAQLPDLRVAARTSAFKFRDANQDVRKVGRQLNVDYIVEGSVRRGRDLIRVTVQMVSVSDGFHMWSKTFNLADADALHIEDTVSRSVAETFNTRLTKETERRWSARQSQVPGAYDLYLQGRSELKRVTREHNQRAMELFRETVEQDRDFPLAYVSLAEATMYSVSFESRSVAEVAPQVIALLDRADALSPDLPEALAVRGWLAILQYRLDDAKTYLNRSLALNPNDAEAHRRLGNLYMRTAQPRHSERQFVLASELDPMDFYTYVRHCLSLRDLADFTAAAVACKRARELDAENPWGSLATSYLDFARGQYADSLQWLERAFKLSPEDVDLLDQRVMLLLEMNLAEEAKRTLARLPEAASPQREFMQAAIAYAQEDPVSLAAALESLMQKSGTFQMNEWLELARLQSISGDLAAARKSLDRARQAADWQAAFQSRPDFFCLGTSNAISIAYIELATGDRATGMRQLDDLETTLNTFEQDGGACAGVYSLRALSRALRGDPESAVANLRKAHDKGWREARTTRREPYLQSIRNRQDFQQVLAATNRELQAEAAAASRRNQ